MKTFTGAQTLQVTDEAKGITFPVLVMYPTRVPSSLVNFGPYTLDLAMDAPIDKDSFPLVIISHGSGSTPYAYRTIASYLARHGYVVALPEHFGNNRNNNELADSDENLLYRPRHVRLSIDAIAADLQFGDRVQTDNAAIIGHSMGGYTALAVAGGQPWSQSRRKLDVESDGRVKALVLMAPAAFWYMPEDSLSDMDLPILVLTAEHDPYTPSRQVEQILAGIPEQSRVTHRVIENAGHFSFLSPFPPGMRNPDFRPSIDPDGFDREAYHEILNRDLLDYLDSVLPSSL
jgi:predicted dienelactone hydrolase